tara:strand:- start:322 stop:1377 length:1056 start_codon:yes stop_codon:yes gene_type:complete
MSVQNLFLTQQMKETQRNLENVQEIEDERRRRGGWFSSIGGGLGGTAGGLLGLALAPFTGGSSLALAGLAGVGTAAGSLLGSRAGLELGGGRRSDATPIGMNRSALTGEEKEFGRDVKDRYRRDVNAFQKNLNNQILSTAIKSGIKAAAFAGANPGQAAEMGAKTRSAPNWLRSKLGMAQKGGLQTVTPDIAGAQAIQKSMMDQFANEPVQRLALPGQQKLNIFDATYGKNPTAVADIVDHTRDSAAAANTIGSAGSLQSAIPSSTSVAGTAGPSIDPALILSESPVTGEGSIFVDDIFQNMENTAIDPNAVGPFQNATSGYYGNAQQPNNLLNLLGNWWRSDPLNPWKGK